MLIKKKYRKSGNDMYIGGEMAHKKKSKDIFV